jgi:hypothetical protein
VSTRELMADGFRGRPDVELREYAHSRGLDFRENRGQLGYAGAFALSEELQFNVMRGVLPGGEPGVLMHQVRLYEEGMGGTYYGVKATPGRGAFKPKNILKGMVQGSESYFRVPFTVAGVRVPESVGGLWGLHVSRRRERGPAGSIWQEATRLRELGLDDWEGYPRRDADGPLVSQVVKGPIRNALAGDPPLGLAITIRSGLVTVAQQHFLKTDAELDGFATAVSDLARVVRECCRAAAPAAQPFSTQLPAPYWLEEIRAKPQDTYVGLDGQDLGAVVAYGDERGLAIEDGRELHRAFPALPTPGEAFAVFRGTLPGTDVEGRLVSCLQRPMRYPEHLEPFVSEGALRFDVGGDAVLLAARPGTPDSGGVDGELVEGLRVSVVDGVVVLSGLRRQWQLYPASLDQIGPPAVAAARSRGLID